MFSSILWFLCRCLHNRGPFRLSGVFGGYIFAIRVGGEYHPLLTWGYDE